MHFMAVVSWLGNVFIVVGLWYIGSKKRFAFLFSMAGEALWIAYSLATHLWPLAFICCVFFAMWVRSWFKWERDKNNGGQ